MLLTAGEKEVNDRAEYWKEPDDHAPDYFFGDVPILLEQADDSSNGKDKVQDADYGEAAVVVIAAARSG